MSKKRNVQIVSSNGVNFGQISSPDDLNLSQDFAHLHAENMTRDFLTQISEFDVAHFEAAPVGLSVNVAAGRIYANGLQFDGQAVQMTFDAPHETLPRIDRIVAIINQDSPEQQTFTPFQRIRTQQEMADGAPAYPPSQFQVPLEKHNKVTILIKKGVAAAEPVAPALEAGEIALYAVAVPAGAVALVPGNFTDQRRLAANLRQMRNEINQMLVTLTTMQNNIATALRYDLINVDWASSWGGVRNIHQVMAEIAEHNLVLKWRFPSILTGNGRIPAVGNVDNNVPVIDIPVGTLVQFGDLFVAIRADGFTDASLNARETTSGINSTDGLFDGLEEDVFGDNNNSTGNTVRINAPSTVKYLYLNRNGSLYFKTNVTPSNSNECLLLRSTPSGVNPPQLLNYVGFRQGVIAKSNVATASTDSKQFIYDIGMGPGLGYIRAYAVKAADNTMYQVQISNISAIDDVISVTGVANGDTWIVEIALFSVY